MRQPKYRNRKTVVDGLTFDSAKEARRWGQLQLQEKAGVIQNLQRQVPFVCIVNGTKVTTYKADFTYDENGAQVVEDAKGFKTDTYKLKKKLILACHGIAIRET